MRMYHRVALYISITYMVCMYYEISNAVVVSNRASKAQLYRLNIIIIKNVYE